MLPPRYLGSYDNFKTALALLLVAERVDRIEVRRFVGRVSAEHDAHDRTDHQANDDPIHRNHRREFHEKRGDVSAQDAEHNADRAAEFAEHHGFHDELRHDISFLGADGATNADLARAFGHR